MKKNPDELVLLVEAIPSNLNPAFATDAIQQNLGNLIHGALVQVGPDLKPHPDLAESWKVDQYRFFEFKLRNNIYYHDGTEIKPDDIISSLQYYTDEKNLSPHRDTFQHIKKISILKNRIIKIETDSPQPFLLTDLVLLKVIKREKEKIIPSGRFKIINHNTGEISLSRNESYWEPVAKNAFKFIKLVGVKEDITRYQMLNRGDVDASINVLSLTLTNALKNQLPSHLKMQDRPGIVYGYLAFNFKDPILNNLKVRQAMAHAISVDDLLQYRFYGMGTRAKTLLTPIHENYNDHVTEYEYNPDKAKKLLDEAGYTVNPKTGTRFEIEIKTTHDKNGLDRSRILANFLEKIEIRTKIRILETATFFSDLKNGNFQIYSSRWIGIADPSIYYRVFHSSQFKGVNRGHYSNPKLDQLLDKAMVEVNDLKRAELFKQIQEVVAADLPYISLWHWNNIFIGNKNLENIEIYPSGNYLMFSKITKKTEN